MATKKDLVVVSLATFCITVSLFMILPTRSNPGIGEYDPWNDLNDDGTIDIYDAITLAGQFGTSGTPINKTLMLLQLQDRVSSIEDRLDQMKMLRFYEPNETVIDQLFATVAVFTWTPNNATNNAILSVRCYFQYLCESQGFEFRVTVNGVVVNTGSWLISPTYEWSGVWGMLDSVDGDLIPNQATYTIRFIVALMNTAFPAYVKNINVILTTIDGMQSSN